MEQKEQYLNNEINIQVVIEILWKRKFLILIITIVATCGAIAYAFIAREEFTSTTMFITKTNEKSNQNFSGLASLAGINLGSSYSMDPSDYLDKIVQDENFLLPVLEKKWFYNGDSLYWDQILKLKPDTTKPDWQYVFKMQKLDFLREGMISVTREKVGALKTTGVLSLNVNMPTARLSYDVNRYVIGLIGNYLRSSMTSQAKEKRVFIEERIEETKPILEASENALAKFRERNQVTNSPNLLLTEMRLTRELNINQELYLQYKKQYELARIDEKNDQTLIQILQNPEIPLYKSKPKRKKVALIGFFGGLILGCMTAFFIESFKKTT